MAAVAKAVLLGFALVMRWSPCSSGRRVRAPVDPSRRGFLGSIKGAFYAAVGVVLGTSAACGEGNDHPQPTCYVPTYDADDRWDGNDADTGRDAPDASCYEVTPDVDSYSPADAEVVDAGDTEPDDGGQSDDADVTPADVDPDVEPDADTADPDADLESGAEAADGEDPDALIGVAPATVAGGSMGRRTLERPRAFDGSTSTADRSCGLKARQPRDVAPPRPARPPVARDRVTGGARAAVAAGVRSSASRPRPP